MALKDVNVGDRVKWLDPNYQEFGKDAQKHLNRVWEVYDIIPQEDGDHVVRISEVGSCSEAEVLLSELYSAECTIYAPGSVESIRMHLLDAEKVSIKDACLACGVEDNDRHRISFKAPVQIVKDGLSYFVREVCYDEKTDTLTFVAASGICMPCDDSVEYLTDVYNKVKAYKAYIENESKELEITFTANCRIKAESIKECKEIWRTAKIFAENENITFTFVQTNDMREI